MPRYRITTLIDITRTDPDKADPNDFRHHQQANFNSLRQTIELRSNVEWRQDPIKQQGRLPDPFEGCAAHWIWEFDNEREDLFLKDSDQTLLLKEDLQGVPIITNLEETADISPAAIQTLGKNINTRVEII
jgi:hypothetical protein